MKVSITTVAYNSEKTISKTIESVLNQSWKDIEYIIMDGQSSDRTVEIARSFEEKFREKGYTFIVMSQKDNGMYDAINNAVKLTSGEIVGNINSDDWYEPEAVEKMAKLYLGVSYDLAWADIKILKPSGNMRKRAFIGKIWTTAGFCHPTMFAKRSILIEFPYACNNMDDDFDMVTRVKKAGKKIVTLNEVLANYSFGGMSTQKSLKQSRRRIAMKYDTYRRNGYSRVYWIYCVVVETAKYIMG